MDKASQKTPASTLLEPGRATPIHGPWDVVVCGGGPSGICAAIAAGRAGARVLVLESQGCLGGVWTSGLLSLILDAQQKGGIIQEIQTRLEARTAMSPHWLYDAEEMKLLLEEMAEESGVEWLLHTRVVAAMVDESRLTHVLVENKSGRSAFAASVFIDATGDGDLAAQAGCGFDFGHPESGLGQPMTLLALVSGVPSEIAQPDEVASTYLPKAKFRDILLGVGHEPSYSQPSLFPLTNGLFCLMIHHAYEVSGLEARDVTAATRNGRAEVMTAVRRLRETDPAWKQVRVVATGNHVGVREGRRIRGIYEITLDDLRTGARFPDAICRVTFPVDVHSLTKSSGGGYDNEGIQSQPYDIPYRALVAKDVEGLLLAGRCISGDFYAHASYRVTGDACATGEAAGKAAAFCAASKFLPHEITWSQGSPRAQKVD